MTVTQPPQSHPSNSGSSGNATLWIVVAGIGFIVGGFIIGMVLPGVFPILPQAGSAESLAVDNLFRFMLVIGGAIFLLVQGVLLYSIIRFRAKPGDRSDGPPIHGNTTLELVWTAIPALIVLAITIYSYQVWVETRSAKPNEQQVHVVGQRFAFGFQYDIALEDLPFEVNVAELSEFVRPEVEDGVVTINSTQLHTFVNQPVYATLETQDVNHAFWIPGMRIKQDLLAGRVTDIRFTPIEPGPYRIVCAELCGSGHGNMAGEIGVNGEYIGAWLIVHQDEETFITEFLEPEARAVLFPPADPVLIGRQILASGKYPCATCHVLTDLNWQGNIGPSLNGIGARTARVDATGAASMEEYLRASIRHPADYLVPGYGNLMPQFNPDPAQPNYMPDTDLDAIVAYLLAQTGE